MSEGVQLRGACLSLWDTFCDEVLVEGPAGCVAGETEIWDPTTGEGRRIDELAWAGEQAWVQTAKGPQLAGVPFVKGESDLYRVWLENGESCLTTPDHLLLSRSAGWKYVASLTAGMEVLTCPENSGGDEWSAVEAVEFERRDAFYDLEVPKAGHYLADGIYHHNTGKTRGILERCYYLGERFPGCRILWVRQTLKSLRQSVMVTWEEEVLAPNSPYLNGTAKRATRDSYVHSNGTEIVLAGADTPEKFLSTQYDFIFVWEAIEVSHDMCQVLTSRNRNGVAPFQQIVFDTNPGPDQHHLNKRFPEGHRTLPVDHPARRIRPFDADDQLVRLMSKHTDNPGFFHADGRPRPRWGPYGRKLDRLVGNRRANLRDGLWKSPEGMIWSAYDPDVHLINAKDAPEMVWYFASFDKGTRQPSCLGIWGVSAEGAMYLVAEVYRAEMTIDWWANVVVELDNEFRLVKMASDHHPEWVMKFNDALAEKGRPRLVENARKDWETSVQLVQDRLLGDESGPTIFFLRDALRYGRCPHRDEQMLPATVLEEIPSIVWAKGVDGKPAREMMEPACQDFDHGFDMVRYAAMFRWGKDYTPKPEPKKYPEGTLGHLFKHDELLDPRRAALRERKNGKKRSSGRWL